jgi:transposase InsO family protein
MRGNSLVQFLEGLEAVTPPGYSAGTRKRAIRHLAGRLPYFFSSLKTECVNRQAYQSRAEAKQPIFEWIEVFYNRQRRHSSLAYLSSIAYEQQSSHV